MLNEIFKMGLRPSKCVQTYKKVAKFWKKNFFTKNFFNYDLRKIRKWLIKKISIGCDTRHIAQTKEEKKGFQKKKKSRGGRGAEKGQISL